MDLIIPLSDGYDAPSCDHITILPLSLSRHQQ